MEKKKKQKKKLLKLNGNSSIKVAGRTVDGKDFTYLFNKKELVPTNSEKKEEVSTYIISEGLVNAVNAAIITGRPLLLKGEPGCGKTKLAKAVASLFYEEDLAEYYFEWHVKSKSKAKEGAYTFDHVSRLRDATISNNDPLAKKRVSDPSNYIELGPMGKAFKAQTPEGNLSILLIDEIDKGDIDFPNDLLLELDEMRFKINELNQQNNIIAADPDKRPLVVITSNDERELPPAFLRRCLYFKIPRFPPELLLEIVNAKLDSFYEDIMLTEDSYKSISQEDAELIVSKFEEIKNKAGTSSNKLPSTSELLDWLKLIFHVFNEEGNLLTIKDLIKEEDLQKLALKPM